MIDETLIAHQLCPKTADEYDYWWSHCCINMKWLARLFRSTSQQLYMKVVWKTSESDTVITWGVSKIFKWIQHGAKWLKHQFMANGKNRFLPFSKGVDTGWNMKLWGVARTSSCHFQVARTSSCHFQRVSTPPETWSYGEWQEPVLAIFKWQVPILAT